MLVFIFTPRRGSQFTRLGAQKNNKRVLYLIWRTLRIIETRLHDSEYKTVLAVDKALFVVRDYENSTKWGS